MQTNSFRPKVAGVVLVGTYPWNYPAFDALMTRALLPIAHRPLLFYSLDWLQLSGIRECVLCGNRDSEAVRKAVGQQPHPDLRVVYQKDPVPRGSAGSILDAASALDADTFVVVEGTSIPTVSLPELLEQHWRSSAMATVVVHEHRGGGGHAVNAPTGVYVINRRALDLVPPSGFCDLKENLVPALYRTGMFVAPYRTAAPSARVMSPATYLAANGWLVESLVSGDRSVAGYSRSAACIAHPTALVSTDAVLVGPVLIGAGARIEPGATIIGPSSIGHDVIVQRGAVVARSSVWRKCVIGQYAVADHVILADGAHLPPHSHAHRTVVAGAAQGPIHVAPRERVSPRQWRRAGLNTWTRVQRLWLSPTLGESAPPS